MTGAVGGPAAKTSAQATAAGLQVLISLSIRLRSQLRNTPAWHGHAAAATAPVSGASTISSNARTTSAAATSTSSSGSASDAAAALPAAAHTLQVDISGLAGLEQAMTAVGGHTEQVGEQQWQDVYTVPLQEQHLLTVDEQVIRSWAAAAGQMQVHVSVNPLPDSNSNNGKKAASSAPAKGAAAAAVTTPIAAGTLQLNCAGLLVGDSSATYSWTQPRITTSPAAEQAAVTEHTLQSLQQGTWTNSTADVSSVGCNKQKLVMQPPSGNLASWLGSAEMLLTVYKAPAVSETVMDTKAAAGRQNSASGSAGAAGGPAAAGRASKAAAEAAISAMASAVLTPCSLLTPEQSVVYNPVVVYAYKAADLPDAPALQHHLDQQCEEIKLKALWPPLVTGVEQAAAVVGGWSCSTGVNSSRSSQVPHSSSSSSTSRDFSAPAVRTALFATPIVFLGSDAGSPGQLLQQCRQQSLVLQVHDRTAKPEAPEYPISTAAAAAVEPVSDSNTGAGAAVASKGKAAAAAAAAAVPTAANAATSCSSAESQTDDGQVFAVASVSLMALVRGATNIKFAVPLCPMSTVRGAASLSWKRRPGNYMQANSVLKGFVRTAVPLHKMVTAADAAAAASSAAAAAAAAGVPVGPAAANRRMSATGGVAGAVSSAVPQAATGNKPPARMSAVQAKLLQQQQAERQQQEILAQQAAAELQRQLEEQQAKDRLPVPSAYVALPPDIIYPGEFTRAVFLFDYKDSDMFHTLEDTVRQHNAIALGLVPPPPPTAEQIAAAEAEAAAAAAKAAAAAEAAAAAAASPLQSRLSTAASRAAAARSSLTAGSAAGLGAKAAVNRLSVVAGPAGTPRTASAATAKTSAAAAAGISAGNKWASQAENTPRSILRLSAAGGSNAASIAAGSSTQQQLPGHAHFARVSELGDSDSESDSDCSSESEPSESEQRLRAALKRYDHVVLDNRLLQGLSTAQLPAASSNEPQRDVLTGFHLVDGALRCVVLEGLASRTGMAVTVPAIARWALEDQQEWQQQQQQQQDGAGQKDSVPQWLPRRVVLNQTIKCGDRLYGSLGVDLWMLKLKATLTELGGQAATYASGQVRPHCIAGMTSLLALTYGYRAPLSCSSSSNSSGNLMPDNASPEATPTRSLMSGNDTGRSHASISSSRATNVPARALQTTTAGRKPANYTAAAMVTSGAATVATAARGGTPAADVTGFNLGRLIDELRLLPTAGQLQLVDKKFGGELTKADVLGVEADESDSEDEEEEEEQQKHSGQQPTKRPLQQQKELSGTHAAAAAAKAASAKLMALLGDDANGDLSGAAAAAAAGSGDAGSRSLKSGRSRRSLRSRNSKSCKPRNSSSSSSKKKKMRSRKRGKNALDMDNEVYLHLRLEAQRRRQQRDLAAEHEQLLHELHVSKQGVRDCWATWNPQRQAARQLQEAVAAGNLTLEDTIEARSEIRQAQLPIPGTISSDESIKRGWCPHDKPFLSPAPRDPATYNQHPCKPSEYRIQELEQQWEEGALHEGLPLGKSSLNGLDFRTLVHGSASGLFTTDPTYWKTVHTGGDCWEEQLAAAKAAATADWAAKVVVTDTAVHVIPGTGDKASAQGDKYANLLKGEPVKKGFRMAQVAPAPASMYALEPWHHSTAAVLGTSSSHGDDGIALGPTSVTKRITSAEKSKWLGDKNFNALGNKSRSAVAKPGFSDAATAALHDEYY